MFFLTHCMNGQDVVTLERIGQTPGGAGYHVNWDEAQKKLIVGCGTSVWVYDMTDPHNPVKIQQRPLLGLVTETDIHGNVLFVAATRDGVYALDYTSPHLDVLDHYEMKEMGDTAAYGMFRSNDTLFVADFYKVRMITYNESSGFTDVGSFGGNRAFGVSRRGDIIAVCGHQEGLGSNGKVSVYTISDLTTPLAEWSSPWINWVQAVQFADLRDDIIYVCGGPETPLFTKSNFFALQFDDSALHPIDTFSVTNGIPGIAQLNIMNMDSRNDTLFVATTAAWDIATAPLTYIPVLDATKLPDGKMEEISRVTPGLWHFDVALMHGTPYAAMSSEWLGVLVSDVSALAFMDTLGLLPTGGWCNASKVKDNTLWACHEGYGLIAYDIDSLYFPKVLWANPIQAHIHSLELGEHFFSHDVEFLNDTLIMLNTSKVYNINPMQWGGEPEFVYDIGRSCVNMRNVHTNAGQRMVATYENLLQQRLEVFDPYDHNNDFPVLYSDNTNSRRAGIAVSGDTIYYGKSVSASQKYLVSCKVENDMVYVLDSIIMPMPWGIFSYHDITSISVCEGIIAVGYGKQFALFVWSGDRLTELFHDYKFERMTKEVFLRYPYLYVAERAYGLRIYDVSSMHSATLVAQARGAGGFMNVFGSQSVTLDDRGRIFLSDFNAGVILFEAFDPALTSVEQERSAPETTNTVRVYPNPATGHAIIDIGGYIDRSEVYLIIHDVMGRMVFKEYISDKTTVRVETNGWTKGLYLISVFSGNGREAVRMLVQ